MSSGTIDVGIVMGSQSDWATLRHAADVLDAPSRLRTRRGIVSAHRTPERLFAYASGAKALGV